MKAWIELTANLVYSWEYDIIVAMDQAFCEETNKEILSIRSRNEEAQKRQAENARSKKGRR